MKLKLPKISEILDIRSPRDTQNPKILDFDIEKLGQKEVYLTWETLGRAEKKDIGIKFTRTFTIIGIFVGLLLIIMQEFFLILVIASMVFVAQVLIRTPPENVKYELSNHGLMIDDKLYYWNQLSKYFFMNRDGVEILALDTTLGFPGRLFISFNFADKEKIKNILEKYLHFLKSEPKTFLETTYEKVMDRFSIEDEQE